MASGSKPNDDILGEYNSIDWRTYSTFSALSGFECFWRDTEALIAADADQVELKNRPKWRAHSEEEIAELFAEIRAIRTAHDEVMTPTFRYAAVIMLFTLFERELRRLTKALAAQEGVSTDCHKARRALFKEVGAFVRKHKGLNFATVPDVDRLHDLQKVRDCLVHCYGDASLSSDRTHLLKLSIPKIGLEVDPGQEMVVHALFIDRSLKAVRRFWYTVFGRLNWTINERWMDGAPRRH